MTEVIQAMYQNGEMVAQGPARSELGDGFLKFCRELERRLELANNLQPSKWEHLIEVSAVSGGQNVNVFSAQSGDYDRAVSEESLRYIEHESKEFPRIAAKYRWALDEAIRQYRSFIA